MKQKLKELSRLGYDLESRLDEIEDYETLLTLHPLGTDTILSILAVMVDVTQDSPKNIINFIDTFLSRYMLNTEIEYEFYKIFYKFKSYENEEDGVKYLIELVGRYHLSKMIALLNYVEEIEILKNKIYFM